MPWSTPTLRDVRSAVRDAITGRLPGADAIVPNSVLRVLSDAMGALCHLTLQYIDWLALQLMPDTAETEWLDRWGYIYLVNADGSTGRKLATPAVGTANFISTGGSVLVPSATQLGYSTGIAYETTADIRTDPSGLPTAGPIQALDPGSLGNLPAGTTLSVQSPIAGILSATVGSLDGGTDDETDDELRARVLQRIRQPPMGGDADDYVRWTLAVPGVTRAWAYPLEMGMGTVTIRFMMDDLRADLGGFPTQEDVEAVQGYLDTVRPVAVKDFFVVAPLPKRIDFRIANLRPNETSLRPGIEQSIQQMLLERAAPGQTIYRAWKSDAVLNAPGVISFDLLDTVDNQSTYGDDIMPDNGHIATLGDIYYE